MKRRDFLKKSIYGTLGAAVASACSFDLGTKYSILEKDNEKYLKIDGMSTIYRIKKSDKSVQEHTIESRLGDYKAQGFDEVQNATGIFTPTLADVLLDYNVREKQVTTKEGRIALMPTDKPVVAVEEINKKNPRYTRLLPDFQNAPVLRYKKQ